MKLEQLWLEPEKTRQYDLSRFQELIGCCLNTPATRDQNTVIKMLLEFGCDILGTVFGSSDNLLNFGVVIIHGFPLFL
jgi:hypothetical protein